MDWLYRFTANDQYPDPTEEIDALCTLDMNDESTFILLAKRKSPPMSGASCGEIIGLCTSQGNRLILHGTATVAGDCIQGDTPPIMQPIYGNLAGRSFCPLKDLERVPRTELPENTLSHDKQQVFLMGQSFVKRLTTRAGAVRRTDTRDFANAETPDTKLEIRKIGIQSSLPAFTVVGLDPTAGKWESQMTQGPKNMPSFTLSWDGNSFIPAVQPLAWHETNCDFWNEVMRRKATLTCIDGPCGTNGPQILEGVVGWNRNPTSSIGNRDGELALSRQGISLFWTTQNTVMKFEGASRWIARSLILFSECTNPVKIETHPHGAFTFLWRLFGRTGTPPKKLRQTGRNARLSLLQSFIPNLTAEMVPNHDAVDAACAALIAGLHGLDLTTAFGTPEMGGQIWMPDLKKACESADT